ncbi:MAG TPA: hypothetical protein VFV34_04250, partial [Blastocatellia bacterium]|nr:hypothetical protein [Blastocatellia bacterium]
LFLVVGIVTATFAQSPEPPISDKRLPVNTLVREDIFAGFLADDMKQFARGEKNIDILLEQRPEEKATLLAWKGGAAYYRAVRAYENKQKAEFDKHYKQALDLFAEAVKAGPKDFGVAAIIGGTNGVLADKLPPEYRAAAWSQAYDAYGKLWSVQSGIVDKLPLHMKGELLAGLAQSAQRTGRNEELQQYLDKMLTVLRDTPYEPVAREWKSNPAAAAKTSIACRSCHDAGRLSARMAALSTK